MAGDSTQHNLALVGAVDTVGTGGAANLRSWPQPASLLDGAAVVVKVSPVTATEPAIYVWRAASTDVDDGVNWIRPTAVALADPGRFQILAVGGGGGGGAGTLQYLVGPLGRTGITHTSIQAAMDDAVTDGATALDPRNVVVYGDTYTEDLVIPDGILLSSLSGDPDVIVVGNHVVADGALVVCHGIWFQGPVAGGAAAVTNTGSASATVRMTRCVFTNLDGFPALELTSTGGGQWLLSDCELTPGSGAVGITMASAGLALLLKRSSVAGDATSVRMTVSSFLFARTVRFQGQVTITVSGGTASLTQGCRITMPSGASAMSIPAFSGTCTVEDLAIEGVTPGTVAIAGSGTLELGNVSVPKRVPIVDPAMATVETLGKSASFQYVVGQQFQPGVTHTTIQSAIDDAQGNGATTFDPRQILVYPGSYTENITAVPGVFVSALVVEEQTPATPVRVVGTFTTGAAFADGDACFFDGITFSVGGATPAGTMTGTTSYSLIFHNCIFDNTGGTAFASANTGASSNLSFFRCSLNSETSHGLDMTGGPTHGATFEECEIRASTATFFAIRVDASFVSINRSDIAGSVDIGGTSQIEAFYSAFAAGGGSAASCIALAAGASGTLIANRLMATGGTATGSVSGTGTVEQALTVQQGTVNFFDPLLSITNMDTEALIRVDADLALLNRFGSCTTSGGTSNMAWGDTCTVSKDAQVATGINARADNFGEVCHSTGQLSSVDQKRFDLQWFGTTPAAAGLVELFLDGTAEVATMRPAIAGVWAFDIRVVATNSAGAVLHVRAEGSIRTDGAATANLVGSVTLTTLTATIVGLTSADITIDANGNTLRVRVNGLAAGALKWVAHGDLSELPT